MSKGLTGADRAAEIAAVTAEIKTLTEAEKAALDEQGYVVLGGMFSPAQAAAFRARIAELAAEEGAEAGKEAHQEKGVIRLADLPGKSYLETEADVDAFVSKLKAELLATVRAGQRVRMQ